MPQELLRPPVRLSRVTDVPADARVRHFDELDEETQTFVARFAAEWADAADPFVGDAVDLFTGDAADPFAGDAGDLVAGDVVIFTDYFSVSST